MQNIGTPRIYVSYGDWWKSMGLDVRRFHLLNPRLDTKITITSGGVPWAFIDTTPDEVGAGHNWTTPLNYKGIEDCNWFASLNHNVDERFKFILKQQINYTDNTSTSDTIGDSGFSVAVNYPIQYSGFSLIVKDNMWNDYSQEPDIQQMKIHYGLHVWDATNGETPYFAEDSMTFNVGCGVFGKTYDFPHSPELNAKQSIEMGQLTRHQSVIGGSLSNSMQTKEMWGDLGAWELDSRSDIDDASKLGVRAGKRVWNLTFSYLSDRDTLPINAMGGSLSNPDSMDGYTLGDDYYDGGEAGTIFGTQGNPLSVLNGEDFFSSVWNKTLGGHLPFIFQPDKTNNNPDQFAICKFDQGSLQVRQTAPSLYSISVKIREI